MGAGAREGFFMATTITAAIFAGPASQPEGSAGGTAAATWTLRLTRTTDLGDVNTNYSYHVFNASGATPSDDFGANDVVFNWAGGATQDVVFTANNDVDVEGNETPIIWFYKGSTPVGVQAGEAQLMTITNDDFGLPVFSTASTINVAENTPAITTVAATSGTSTITYAITGGADAAKFAITGAGALTFVAGAGQDFEGPTDANTDNHYEVKVRATGNGTADSTEGTFDVVVTNANEAPTIAGGDTVPTAMAENNQAVATVTATDPDAGDALTWSISGGADASKFTINSAGALSFAANPNFDTAGDANGDNVYNVVVRATDAGGLFDEQQHNVTLTNADDPAVITSYSGAELLFLHASENTATTTTLATVVAADDDAGSTITWSTGGPDGGLFTAVGGVLKFTASPDFEAPSDFNGDNVFDVTVTATPTSGAADNQQFLIFLDNVVEAGETSSGGGGGFVLPTPPTPPTTPATNATDDNYAGGDEDNTTNAGAGNDTIDGGAGNDCLDGDTGNDKITGGTGADFIRGLNDADTVDGGDGNDTVNGNLGEDSVSGGAGADSAYGGQGNDTVDGGDGDDPYVNGNIGDDLVHGGYGNDSVYGGQNNDTIYGDDGDDRMSGDLGNDIMFGGNGADRFALTAGGGADWVADFRFQDGDRILLAPGTTYTASTYQNQVLISLSDGSSIGLVGVSTFDAGFIVFGS
jgi:Ca2+-binding RTX toxin-like protein